MVYQSLSDNKYREIFKKKFKNFADKIAVLISYTITENNVIVKHENSGQTYEFIWDFNIPVKAMIKNIHDQLYKHLPIIVKEDESEVETSAEERAKYILEGKDFPISKKEVKKTAYIIEKVLLFKDDFILNDTDTNRKYRYKMKKSCVYFLSDYRKGKFSSFEDAGKYFFDNSEFLYEIRGTNCQE